MSLVNSVFTAKIASANADVVLVPAVLDFVMASLLITNKNTTGVTVNVKLIDGNGTELASIIHNARVGAGETMTPDIRSLAIPAQSYALAVRSDTVNVDFTASGGVFQPNT